MKKSFVLFLFCLVNIQIQAQHENEDFHAYLYNKEFDVFLDIDFYNESITIPGQDLYGSLPGYIGKKKNNFCWVITSAEIKGKSATLNMINDFGSEDLIASLTRQNDSLYIFRQKEGSPLKMAQNGKWQKMPKKLEFIRQK